MSEIGKAIETLAARSQFVADINLDAQVAYKLAIQALQEKAEREKGCEFCNNKLTKLLSRTGFGSFIRLTPNKAEAFVLVRGFLSDYFEIEYCPMCGRKLVEE